MKLVKVFIACVITLAVALGTALTAQVQTIVPDPVPGAKPVAVEHIKIHSAAMEGNLEGEAVDRDVIVSCRPATKRKSTAATRSSTRCTASSLELSSGRMRFMCRRPSKAHSPRAPKK